MSSRDLRPKPLPGSRPVPSAGMSHYIVTLKEEDELSRPRLGRHEVYDRGIARTAAFQQRLQQWLEEKGLTAEVADIGEPTTFPMVMLTCTPRVAKSIASLPEVDSVFRDSEDLQFIR